MKLYVKIIHNNWYFITFVKPCHYYVAWNIHNTLSISRAGLTIAVVRAHIYTCITIGDAPI